ncbi:Tir chaperone family protein [Shewanella psychropiezotolerans]|uniref:Tir chaperone family protein n=1 Tax=Shewanella psychropiezotolerans TaxID=2593655 RepID=A0ABX5X519_9GAMM|nr:MULTISPECIES: CesT family type III secretion system chaperone [Shewanella]MPY25660.1 Tir chaperone family protein [Shewanella sp. YLB-07]QDO86369.1 Tir chaperone family protein [Shewanella psychropiezotolerans]
MSEQYKQAISSLYKALSLTMPEIEKITSLQIGEQVAHITEHPEGQLLMFSDIGVIDNFNLTELLKLNMFSQSVYKPVIGLDTHSNSAVIWSRQSLSNGASELVYQQLEQLSQASDIAIDSVKEGAVVITEPSFDANRFRV